MKRVLNITVSSALGCEQNREAFKSTDQLIQQGYVSRFSTCGKKVVLLEDFILFFKKCPCCVVSVSPVAFISSISLTLLPTALPDSKGNSPKADLNLPQLSKDSLLSPLRNSAAINRTGISIFEAALN